MLTCTFFCTLVSRFPGKGKKIQFEFNLQHDQATEVAADLVEEILKDRGASMPPNPEQRNHFIKNLKGQFTQSIEETGAVLCLFFLFLVGISSGRQLLLSLFFSLSALLPSLCFRPASGML